MMEAPETRYVRSSGAYIAYRIMGSGPVDLVLLQGGFSHVELQLEEPSFARFLGRLASFSRLIVLDVRGTGLSDRTMHLPTLEEQVDDVLAVLDAVGCERAGLFGVGQGGVLACLFAAAHPGRATALVLFGTCARLIQAEGYPWGRAPEEFARLLQSTEQGWGQGVALPVLAPSMAGDEPFQRWFAKLERLGASPGNMLALLHLHRDVDIRHVLPAIRVPALVMHRVGDAYREVGHARYLAAHIPGAKLVELPGRDHLPYVGDQNSVLDEVEEFLTGVRRGPEPDRVLATILFTDIVGSTERAAQAGDDRWRDLLDRHNVLIRRELDHFRGREVDTAGDGFLATFDGSALAVRCACGNGPGPGPGVAQRPAYGGGRARRRTRPRNRGPHRRPGRGDGRAARGASVLHREGPGRGLGDRIRGPRRALTQGHPRHVADLPRRVRLM